MRNIATAIYYAKNKTALLAKQKEIRDDKRDDLRSNPGKKTMNISPFVILVVISLVLSVAALIKPSWPLLPVAVLLVCVALLIGKT